MRRILDKRKMTEADWQIYRQAQQGIGGSDCATILGVNPYKSKFNLWLEKTGQVPPQNISNEYMEWGNLLEPVIREKFKTETGFKVFQNNFVLQHDLHEWMVANLDGECIDPAQGGRGVLEIKTTREHNKKEWETGVPIYYLAQIQHYLAVVGYTYAYCAVLIGGSNFKYYFIERDDYIIDQIIKAEMEFMEMVKKRIPPEIGGSKSESDWLQAAFPIAVDEEMFIPNEIEAKAIWYTELQQKIKELTEKADELKNQIKLEGKDFKTLRGSLVKINMPTINKTIFDSKLFSAEHPELYNEYKTKTSSYRSFNVTLLKGE